MARIGFCVYNTSMSRYTFGLLAEFLQNKNDLFVFHIDKLTTDRSKNNITSNQNIVMFDVSYYSNNRIIELVQSLKIDVVVFFTFQSLLDRYMWNICSILKIPTILFDHGIVFGDKVVGISKYKLSFIRIFRKFFFSIKNIELYVFKRGKITAKTFEFDQYLLFSENNYNYYKTFFNLNTINTTITGIPLFKDENELNYCRNFLADDKILYIHQPLRALGFSSISKTEEVDFINKINNAAIACGFKLEIRMHPSQSMKEFADINWHDNITFDNLTKLEIQAAQSKIIIGHWSTALTIAFPLNKPLVILEYPKIASDYLLFLSIFRSVGKYCNNVEQLQEVILNLNDFKTNSNNWVYLIGEKNTVQYSASKLDYLINNINSRL